MIHSPLDQMMGRETWATTGGQIHLGPFAQAGLFVITATQMVESIPDELGSDHQQPSLLVVIVTYY